MTLQCDSRAGAKVESKGLRYFVYRGRSMSPSLSPGELLVCAGRTLSCGSVIAFRSPLGPVFAHRLVRKTPGGVVATRGDAHLRNDRRAVRPEDVLGVVTAVMRNGRVIPLHPANPELIRLRLLAKKAWAKLKTSLGLNSRRLRAKVARRRGR